MISDDPAGRILGDWDPARASWLTEVFHNGAAAIYAVNKQRRLHPPASGL